VHSVRILMAAYHAQGAFPFTTSAPTQVALTLLPSPTTSRIGEPMRSVPVQVSGGEPYLYNEEQVIPYITWPQRTRATHVIGGVGAACREWAYRQLYLQWSDPALTRQGRTARASSYAETLQLCRVKPSGGGAR
jgi:hypothetical protein